MNGAATKAVAASPGPKGLRRLVAVWPIVVFAVVLSVFTHAPGFGDTNLYVTGVMHYESGHYEGPFSPILEFGHLIWRPIGVLAGRFTGLVPDAVALGPRLKLAAVLSLLSEMCGILAGALMFDIIWGASGSRRLALFIAACFLCADASLTYLKTGNAYVPGLLFVTLALWCAMESGRGSAPRPWMALLAGASVGIAALLWFPNVLLAPAVAVAALIWNTPGWDLQFTRRAGRWRSAAAIAAGCGLVVTMGYVIAIVAGKIRTVWQFLAWYRFAQADWDQNRKALRAISGFPRMLFDLSGDGIMLKRFAFHDPYAGVTLASLILRSFWKLGLFYLCVALTIWLCRRGKRQQEALVAFAAALGCVGFFAVSLFEPSSISRFTSVLPFFFVCVALALTARPRARAAGAVIATAVSAAAVFNVGSFTFANCCAPAIAGRLLLMQGVANKGDLVVAINGFDDLYFAADQCLYWGSDSPMRVLELVDPSSRNAAHWRSAFAARTAGTWAAGRAMWIPRRLLKAAPLPAWNWTEADNAALHWRDFPAFFGQFTFDGSIGGNDGFLRLAPSSRNAALLKQASP